MKIKRQRRFHAEVSTASLNDIMFFLLLFFLIISTLGNPNVIKLLLPKSSKSAQDVPKTKPVALTITKDKIYYINSTAVPLPQLEERLIAATANMDEPVIILRVDNSVTVQELVDVMSLGAKLKIKMVMATELNQ